VREAVSSRAGSSACLILRRDEAIVVTAAQQSAAEGEFVMPMFGSVASRKNVLHPLENCGIEKQRMGPFVGRIAPLMECLFDFLKRRAQN
jgi:hypothetical protein